MQMSRKNSIAFALELLSLYNPHSQHAPVKLTVFFG